MRILAIAAILLVAAEPAQHWAFRPVSDAKPPHVRNESWVRNPIDAFLAARHEQTGLIPAPEASRRVLVRRLSFDLTGLPPTPEEVERAQGDQSADWYERCVDRLLASPQYGEHWARHWLDLARWAESEGYESNHPRPFAWRYRDWVVRAFNDDQPFADFVRAQLAGDEMLPYRDDNLIATGFLASGRLSSNEEDKARQRNDVLVDIVNTTGSVFLGLTVGCAQCHDHKFDPISLVDYYRLQAFFVRGQPGNFELKDPRLWTAFNAAVPAEYEQTRRIQRTVFETTRARLIADARKALPPETRKALDLAPEKRTPEQVRLALEADVRLQFGPTRVENAMAPKDRQQYTELKKKIDSWEKTMPARPQTWAYYSPATSPTPVEHLWSKGFYPLPYEPSDLSRAKAFTLLGGELARRGTVVEPGWPAVFGPTPKLPECGTRLALADWIVNAHNPLSYRVYVNRVWQYHFGRGLVATPSNFGITGTRPTHPELLDWLAGEFVRTGGRTKQLHRLIVCSAAYRMAAQVDANNAKIDPENRDYWRWTPRHLSAEGVRDSLLAATGELDLTIGGPGQVDEMKTNRRALYLRQTRDQPPPLIGAFDGPSSAAESCPRRQESTTPVSALFLLNNPFATARRDALAARVRRLAGDDLNRQIETAFLLTLNRKPDDKEWGVIRKYIAQEIAKPAGPAEPHQILPSICHVLINATEFLRVP